MSNGYTYIIGKGATFREFATRCARAMTPCAKQREESIDVAPRLQEPDTRYEDKQIEAQLARLAELRNMSPADREKAAHAEFVEAMDAWREDFDESSALRSNYEAMMAAVEAWQAPTPEHEGLRKFMSDVLKESIRYDCTTRDAPSPKSADVWFANEVEYTTQELERAVAARREEISTTARRNAWIAALLESLPAE